MASSVVKKRSDGKRPSRLLNLNKSPRAQKQLAISNAADSPLLLLPPEIRCRIWDYVFSDIVVYTCQGSRVWRKHHHLKSCPSPKKCQSLDRRPADDTDIRLRLSRIGSTRNLPLLGRDSQFTACLRPSNEDIPLHVLHVCRQIYHEAVLTPFTQARVYFAPSYCMGSGLKKFLDTLIPAQAQAIAHLCGIFLRGNFMSEGLLHKLKGLKRLDINFSVRKRISSPLDQLESFAQMNGVKRLATLNLASGRFTVDMEGIQGADDAEVSVLEWIRRQEEKIVPKQRQLLTAG